MLVLLRGFFQFILAFAEAEHDYRLTWADYIVVFLAAIPAVKARREAVNAADDLNSISQS